MLKVELHTHTSDDPHDFIPYDAITLIDRAKALGYHVVAITLHDKQCDIGHIADYARERGMVVIPGIERTICGKHVLLLNFARGADKVNTFEDLRRLKRRSGGLVIAPHPFFPTSSCLRGQLERHADVFDAVEVNACYTRAIDFNQPARRWAAAHGKPLVGNGDVHRLGQLDTTYSLVDAELHPDAICDAIRAGRVAIRTRPLSTLRATSLIAGLVLSDLWRPATSERSWPLRAPENVRL